MQYTTPNRLPEVTKNLLIINVLMYIAQLTFHPWMSTKLAMYPVMSEGFEPYQIITHMFMHSIQSPFHIFFNMFALFMFGRDIEYTLGAKRFLIFYLLTGLGAAFLHQFAGYMEYQYLVAELDVSQVTQIDKYGFDLLMEDKNFINPMVGDVNLALNRPALGASGAIYGLLAAFGMLYPNRMIMLLIPPIPMKAKYFVLIFAGMALYFGITDSQGGVAHFAHLGGAIFGAILIFVWRKSGNRF
ncbi:MAG: rhomboid family intramembrane serine protease [Saprospiraceae bacterium]|nr:rhomboid family intramembrane serine protease [Saprospiraceae bacterium]